MKSLEARINERSSHGLNQVLSEVANQNANWWVWWDIWCLSRDVCVSSVSCTVGCSSDEVPEELLVGTAGRVLFHLQNIGFSTVVSSKRRPYVRIRSVCVLMSG